jgi:threonine synthase
MTALRCPKCGNEPDSTIIFSCGSCDSILEVIVEIGHLTRADLEAMSQSRDRTGEGCTPLINATRLGEQLGFSALYLKNDTVLPTGSLKDRSNSVGLSRAKELGFSTATVVSTGNAAASVAAYSGAAGLKSVVMVPAGTAPSKITQSRAYGATVIVIDRCR